MAFANGASRIGRMLRRTGPGGISKRKCGATELVCLLLFAVALSASSYMRARVLHAGRADVIRPASPVVADAGAADAASSLAAAPIAGPHAALAASRRPYLEVRGLVPALSSCGYTYGLASGCTRRPGGRATALAIVIRKVG